MHEQHYMCLCVAQPSGVVLSRLRSGHCADVHSGQAHAVAQVHALAPLPADNHLLYLEPARRGGGSLDRTSGTTFGIAVSALNGSLQAVE